MPSVKYHIEFKEEFGRTVNVYLIQQPSFGTPIELTGDSNPVTISYQGEEGDIFQTMITSKATIRILLPESGSELFEDLATMDENTFGVMITIDDDGVGEYVWNGWLVPDEQVKTFSYTNQTITLTAIDPISRLKGQKLLNADETYVTGVKTLKYLVERCFDEVYTYENTFLTYVLVVKSKMVLSTESTTIFPDILEQLQVSAEAFNDDMGRPQSAFDVVRKIANSLLMRCFYENGNIYFVDILDFAVDVTTPRIPVYYKDFAGVDLDQDVILLGNTENISTTRTFKESRSRFEYNGTVGLIKDGFLSNWEAFGGGFRLVDWVYNDKLISEPDVYNRRVGTGRQESPYGILIKSDPYIMGQQFDMILGKSDNSILAGVALSISIKFKAPNQALLPLHNDEYDIDIPIGVGCCAILFNPENPAESAYYTRIGSVVEENYMAWKGVDLSGTDFEDGNWDLDYTIGGTGASGTRTSDKQTVKMDLAPTPDYITGKLFLAVNGVSFNTNLATPDASAADTIIYEVIVSQTPKNIDKETTTGEINYITRKIKTSQEFTQRDIDLNTTINGTVAGSLSSPLSYELFGETIPPGIVGNVGFTGYSGLLGFGIPLLFYNAVAQMWLNYPQYKIECETRGRDNSFYKGIDFSCFYDATRPSTAIYNSTFVQTTSQYEIKKATRRIMAISMKINARDISDDTLDDTYDLGEFYFIT